MEIYFRGLDREEVSRIGLEAARRAEFAMDADAAREIGRYASCGRDAVNMVQMAGGLAQLENRKEITAADIAWVAASGRYPERPDERAAACSRMGMNHGLAVQEGGCVPGGENRRTAPLPAPLSAAMADGCNSGSIHI